MTDLVVGIEATPERVGAVACSLGGQPGGWVTLPGLRPLTSPPAGLISRAAAAALRQARHNLGPVRLRAVFVALEGPEEPEGGAGEGRGSATELRTALGGLLDEGGRLGFGDTLETAFEAAAAGGWGVLLQAGRRCAALGRSPDGTTVRLGGRGGWLDEASALDVGRRAVQAAVRHLEQRGPATALTGLLEAHQARWARWARLSGEAEPLFAFAARATLEAAEGGDGVAQGILREAASALASLARGAAARLRWPEGEPVPLYLTGELLRSPLTVAYLKDRLARLPAGPPLRVRPPLLSPPAGAALAAARLAGADVRRMAQRLAPQWLGAGLYGL